MLRPAAVLLLLVPLSLNGLRVVCIEQPDAAASAAAVSAGQGAEDCDEWCAYRGSRAPARPDSQPPRGDSEGRTGCLLTASDDATCVTAFAFGPATPAPTIELTVGTVPVAAMLTAPLLCPGPAPTVLTPPPRA